MKNIKFFLCGILLGSLFFSSCSFIVNPMIDEKKNQGDSSNNTNNTTCNLEQPEFSIKSYFYGYSITFSEVSDAKYYQIYRGTSSDFSSAAVVDTLTAANISFSNKVYTCEDINSSSFTFTNYRTYYYWVVSCDKKKNVGKSSNYKSAEYFGGVKNLTSTEHSTYPSTKVNLSWTSISSNLSSDAKYRIYVLDSSSSKPDYTASSGYTENSGTKTTFTKLVPTVPYYFWVVPYVKLLDSDKSSYVNYYGTGSYVYVKTDGSDNYNAPKYVEDTYERDLSEIKFRIDVSDVGLSNYKTYYSLYASKTPYFKDSSKIEMDSSCTTDSTIKYINITLSHSSLGVDYDEYVYVWFLGGSSTSEDLSAPSPMLTCYPY